MKTKANQSAAEKNITMVALADIQPSGFNPRKRFDETSLYELAESIKQMCIRDRGISSIFARIVFENTQPVHSKFDLNQY